MKKNILRCKKCMTLFFLCGEIILSAMLPSQKIYAQNANFVRQKPCGTYKINAEALKKAKDFELLKGKNLVSASYSVRVYFHICRDDNGTNAAATESQIQNEFNQLVTDYAGDNICFVNMGLRYINNTALNNIDADNLSSKAVLQLFLIPGCINIFYHASLVGAGGTAYSIPNTFCSIDSNNIGSSRTISHEVGHCFGLLHTFEPAYGYENIDGTNASSAGDQIADTPADPYVYKGQSCFTTSSCCYTGNCTDPKGRSNFTPPYTNLMAYWWTLGYRSLVVTNGQYVRTNSYLSTNSALQACMSPSTFTLGPVSYTSGYHMHSAINTLTTNGTVNIGGTTVTSLGGNLVSLLPGFLADASGGATILIRSSACSSASLISSLNGNSQIGSKADNITKQSPSNLKCYPNPFSGKFTVEFNLMQDDKVSVKLFDLAGKQLKIIEESFLNKGSRRIVADLPGLSPGIYILVVQRTKFRMEQKMIKVN